jgi:chemotaxis protein methyltransferase CheR
MISVPESTPTRMADVQTHSKSVMAALNTLLETRTGQQLAANREWRIETALTPLLRDLKLATLDDLVTAVRHSPEIADQTVDALLNQESSFFRDTAVIELVAEAVAALRAEQGQRRVRIWSAGCSVGQEPLSLAMLFAEAGVAMPEIVATDVSAAAIARARAGSYSQFEIQRGLPIRRMMRWFESAPNDHWVAQSKLLSSISYRRHNLVVDPAPGGTFDLILCRNVLFYLAPHLREQVLERLASALKPSGVLLLGAGETVIGQSDRLRPCRRARGFYERVGAPETPEQLYTAR